MNKIKCIYAIKDKRLDKVLYIGQTKDFKQRKSRHFVGKSTPIDNYMYEQGRDIFEMLILEELSDNISIEELRNKENEYILKYNTIENGLNKWRSGNISFDKREYNREYYREYNREYRKSEKFKEYNREYQRKLRLKKKQEKLNKSTL